MRIAPIDIPGLAKFILSSECKSIAILSGAGISAASGIPDFRSPGGMYQTLRPELITATPAQRYAMQFDPTNVVTWDMFRVNPFPYLEVRRPFILGTQQQQWKATIAHRLAELLHVKTNKLTRLYTQNIDGLDRQCDEIPLEKMVYVHGTISQAKCEGCGHEADFDEFCEQVRTKIRDIYRHPDSDTTTTSPTNEEDSDKSTPQSPVSSSHIKCDHCGKPLVKPATVLFGRSLPLEFFDRAKEDLPNLDLLLIMGTSLVVSPANSLASNVPASTLRVVINVEPVGEFLGIDYSDEPHSNNKRDLFLQGTTDEVCLKLIRALGWLEDLKRKRDLLPPSSVRLLERYD